MWNLLMLNGLTGHNKNPCVMHSQRSLTAILFTDIVGSTGHVARLGDREQKQVVEVRERLAGLGLQRRG